MTTTATQTTTFAVDDVSARTGMLPTEKVKESVQKLLGIPVEACDSYSTDVVQQPGFHTLIAAADLAYRLHYPLVLSPDAIWLTIAQGFANHVNNDAETLRPRLVSHQGKVRIEVRRDDFVRGSPENPWAEVWPIFSEQIKEHLGAPTHGLIVADFSTTGPREKAASEVVLMDCVQSYFSYEFHTLCGIPAVTLEGTVEDWEKVHDRVGRLGEYDLSWWTDQVRAITEEFVKAAKGQPTHSFWKGLYKEDDGSGGPYLSGWLVRLLPYLKHREYRCRVANDYRTGYFTPWETNLRNFMLEKPPEEGGWMCGLTHSQLPSSASKVPFVWDYLGTRLDYQFVTGVLTITQDADTGAIRPRVGWAVSPAASGAPLRAAGSTINPSI
jgi:hypothetical protein